MRTCEYAGVPIEQARSHPWTDATGNPEFRYYDLAASPEHIRTSLEDFLPWSHYAAVEDFYQLLDSLNGPHSAFESNDSAFLGPEPVDPATLRKAFQCSGRVILLYRELERNTHPGGIERLTSELHRALAPLDPRFEWGVVGTTLVPARYRALADKPGSQLMISFWAWGDSEADTMVNLKRLFANLSRALSELR